MIGSTLKISQQWRPIAEFYLDFYDPQKINPNDFCHPLTCSPAPSWGTSLFLLPGCLASIQCRGKPLVYTPGINTEMAQFCFFIRNSIKATWCKPITSYSRYSRHVFLNTKSSWLRANQKCEKSLDSIWPGLAHSKMQSTV